MSFSISRNLDATNLIPWIGLAAVGAAWGLTGPLSKVAISSGHHPIGVTFWNTLISAVLVTSWVRARRVALPLSPRHMMFYGGCGLLGTAVPHSLSFAAYQHLPVGIVVMVISTVPIATLLLSLIFGMERATPTRIAGIGLGTLALLMITVPKASLPDPEKAAWIFLPVIVALSYAAENVYIARARPDGISPTGILCGLCWGAVLLLTPAMLATGSWFDISRFDAPELAIVAISMLHVLAYGGFIWLIGLAGPVFAAQVGYVVTGTGVLLGMAVFGEQHSIWVWAALAMMVLGLALVKPRRCDAPRGLA